VLEAFQSGQREPTAPTPAHVDEPTTVAPGTIFCAACRRPITTDAARFEIGGRHEHECVNPHGWRWRIGCFAAAEGLAIVSEPESHWSWFPGYTWEIENCAGCGTLIGWRYRAGGFMFHGLILAHLTLEPARGAG